MAILLIAFAVVVAIINHGHGALFVLSIVNAVLAFWGNGVSANFRPSEAQAVPTYAAALGMLTLAGSIILLILHFVV